MPIRSLLQQLTHCSKAHKNEVDKSKMHSPLSFFLLHLVQSHGYGVEDVTVTDDSATCMLPRFCLSNGEDSACDTEGQNGPLKRIPSSFDMALAESDVVEIKKVSRWESVTPPKSADREMSTWPVSAVIGLRGLSSGTRPSTGIPKRNTSSDSTLSLPQRKVSMDSFPSHNARQESPKQNASFDQQKSGSLNWSNQAKNASNIARIILFDS